MPKIYPTIAIITPSSRMSINNVDFPPPITLTRASSYFLSLKDPKREIKMLRPETMMITNASILRAFSADPIKLKSLVISIAGVAACISVFSLILRCILSAWILLPLNFISKFVIDLSGSSSTSLPGITA